MATTKYKKLHCEAGNHDYDWPVKRGRKPKNCEAHKVLAAVLGPSPALIATRIKTALDEALARYPNCTCPIDESMTIRQLNALECGCTAPMFACPVLDFVRRAVA